MPDWVSIDGAGQALGAMGVTWVVPVLLGFGLAAATGLRTFLPMLMAAGAERLGLFGLELNDGWAWATSDAALIALGVAAVVEFLGDKVPVVDNALHSLGLVARPAAGAVVAGSVFAGVDPTTAAVAGVIVGAPTALAFGAAQGTTRAASTVGTGGLGNPLLSLFDDLMAPVMVVLTLLAPLLILPLLILMMVVFFRLARRVKRFRDGRRARDAEAGAGLTGL